MKVPFTNPPTPRNSRPVTGRMLIATILMVIFVTGNSCGFMHNLFAKKSGCPSDGKNVGAERILSGEKVPRAPRFKA